MRFGPASGNSDPVIRNHRQGPAGYAHRAAEPCRHGPAQALLLQDSLAIGQAQIFKPDGTSTVLPITKKSKGTTMVRTELQRPEGTQVQIANNGAATLQLANGKVRSLITNNTVAERVEHIPALSLLSDSSKAEMELKYVGSDSVSGQPADIVSISYIPSGAQDPNSWRGMTRTLFYIDQSTKFVTKIQYQNFAEDNTNLSEKVEILFSGYRAVNGVFVPFQQSTYSDGQLPTYDCVNCDLISSSDSSV